MICSQSCFSQNSLRLLYLPSSLPPIKIISYAFYCHTKISALAAYNQICLFSLGFCLLQAQSCLTLCNSMDCSRSGFTVHEIVRARILEWLPFLPPEDLLNPGIEPESPAAPTFAGGFFTTEPPGKPPSASLVTLFSLLFTLLLMKGKTFVSYQEDNLLSHLHILYQIFKCFLCYGPL